MLNSKVNIIPALGFQKPKESHKQKKQSRTKLFSLGTKLILSFVGLIVFSGVVLDLSTITLLRQDKKTYTYQLQSSEAYLVGKNFVNSFQGAIDLLNLSLSLINPTKTLSDLEKGSLQSVLNHQTPIVLTRIKTYKPGSFDLINLVSENARENQLIKLGLTSSDLTVSDSFIKDKMNLLIKQGYLITNVSKLGGPAIIAVAVTDVNPISNSNDIVPVAFGFFPIESLTSGIKASRLTVSNQDGEILYDTDSPSQFVSKSAKEEPLFLLAKSNQSLPNGTKEFEAINGTKFLGSYFKPGLNLIVFTQTPLVKAMKATYILTEKLLFLGFISVFGSIIFAILFSKTLVSPLIKLYEATKKVAKGDFNLKLNVDSKDEIGYLASSFETMSQEISVLVQERVRKVHLENQFNIASTVQQNLIPAVSHETNNVSIFSHYQPAEECGGDWWGFFEVGNKTYVMIADATGHGLPSALITASARSCFSLIQKLVEDESKLKLNPSDILSYCNRVIFEASQGKILMTCFVGVFDFSTSMFTYANAGHNPPYFLRKKENKFIREGLSIPSIRLGDTRELPANEIKEEFTSFNPDDILFLYTDGIIEGTNLSGDEFGKNKFRKSIDKHVINGPKIMVKQLMTEFMSHNKDKSLDDDVTLVAIKIKNSGVSDV